MRITFNSPVRLFAEGICTLLLSLQRFDAVLAEHDAGALESTAVEFRADVALFDVTTEDVLVVARTTKALCSDVMTVAMAVPEVAEDVVACVDAGFAAYIPRDATAEEMLAIVDRRCAAKRPGKPSPATPNALPPLRPGWSTTTLDDATAPSAASPPTSRLSPTSSSRH